MKTQKYFVKKSGTRADFISTHATSEKAAIVSVNRFLGLPPSYDDCTLCYTEGDLIEYYRQPSSGEIKRGYGAIHMGEFKIEEVLNKNGTIKSKFRCPYTGKFWQIVS